MLRGARSGVVTRHLGTGATICSGFGERCEQGIVGAPADWIETDLRNVALGFRKSHSSSPDQCSTKAMKRSETTIHSRSRTRSSGSRYEQERIDLVKKYHRRARIRLPRETLHAVIHAIV